MSVSTLILAVFLAWMSSGTALGSMSQGGEPLNLTKDAFGNVVSDSNPGLETYVGFAGGLQDRDTGLVRFGYRDYLPDVGRWTARDPIGIGGREWDLYSYVANNPVNWIDPLGLIIRIDETLFKRDVVLRALAILAATQPDVYYRISLDPHRLISVGGVTGMRIGKFGNTITPKTSDRRQGDPCKYGDQNISVHIYFDERGSSPYRNVSGIGGESAYAAWVLAHEFQHVLGVPDDAATESDPSGPLIDAEKRVLNALPYPWWK